MFLIGKKSKNIENDIKPPKEIDKTPIKWFSNNQRRLNTDKCHFLLNNRGTIAKKIGSLCVKTLHMKSY